MESLFAPNSSELKQETTLRKPLELGKTKHVSGYDFADLADSHTIGNTVDNSALLEQLEKK